MAGGRSGPDDAACRCVEYEPGTWGPPAADEIVDGGDTWHDPAGREVRAVLNEPASGFSAGCGQYPVGQRSLRGGSRRSAGALLRRRAARALLGHFRRSGARRWGSPTTWEACRSFAPGSTTTRSCSRMSRVPARISLLRAGCFRAHSRRWRTCAARVSRSCCRTATSCFNRAKSSARAFGMRSKAAS